MNIVQLASLRRSHGQSRPAPTPHPVLSPVSRRSFVRTTAGVIAAGAAATAAPLESLVSAHGSNEPVPIPIGSFGFHVNAPGFPGLDPPDADPSTITDFHGFVGLAYISGTVVRTNRNTREKIELPFLFSDMRFMQGRYKGSDGRLTHGTFGFI